MVIYIILWGILILAKIILLCFICYELGYVKGKIKQLEENEKTLEEIQKHINKTIKDIEDLK